MDLITIVIPVYNVEKYLDRCMETVINQTYKNLEILLVDDGATDSSPIICDKYASMDERVKVIHKKNGGLSDARNVAIDIAKGKYIAFVDSDDYVALDMIEKLYEAAKKYDSQIAICAHYTEKGEELYIDEPTFDSVRVMDNFEAQKLLIQDKEIKNYAWDKLYDLSLFEGVRYPYGRNYEDIPTTYLLFDKAEKICQIPEYLYYYQIREDSISYSVTDEKWHKNCKALVLGHKDRYEYYREKGMEQLREMAFSNLVIYMYTYIMLSYKLKREKDCSAEKKFLIKNAKEVYENKFISTKDKKLLKKYTASNASCRLYFTLARKKKVIKKVKKVVNKAKSVVRKSSGKYNFDLKEGKSKRIIFFELPCFDNLGDHAIAYATLKFLRDYEKKNKESQVFRVKGWDTVDAIKKLKSSIGKDDVIVCQGGGNMGNLYDFAEAVRKKIMKAFADKKIIIFPQTVFYTDDSAGRKAKEADKKIYNNCKNLTILARDPYTYKLMKSIYNANIEKMSDIVAYLDESDFASKERDGIILCLRSDIESSLKADEKKMLYKVCRDNSEAVLVTDTVIKKDVTEEEREKHLFEKWKTFGKSRLVVTDRLHGMIFCMITKTPCVIIGNNHHKVKETYKTFEECDYLMFCENVGEVEGAVKEMLKKDCPKVKTAFSLRYEKLMRLL